MAGDIKSSLWTRYSQSSSGYCLSFVHCLRCVCVSSVCLYVCTGGLHRDSDRIQHQLLLAVPPPPPHFSLPSSPPTPPFLWHPPCPNWLDNTQPLYATCPSARLHLREPLSLRSELPLAAFVWILVKPPLRPPLSSLSFSLCLALFCSLCCPLQTQTHIQTSDCLCQLFPTSASRHKGLPPLPPSPLPPPLSLLASHLWPGCQDTGAVVSCRKCWLLNQIGKIEISMKLMIFYEFRQVPKQWGNFNGLFISRTGQRNSSCIASYLCQDNYVNSRAIHCMSTAGHWGYLSSIRPAPLVPLPYPPPPLTLLRPPRPTVISSLRLWSGL